MDRQSQESARLTHDQPAATGGDCRSPSESTVWRRRALLLIAALLAGRWVYAACVPLELAPDEAYYWDWSRRLDWCYFSKPPMVAWLIRLATEIGGSTAWVVRSPAVILSAVGLWWLYLLAARMFDARVGFWAVVLCAATPGNFAMGLLMTIDAPFLFCWGLAMYCLWRMLERPPIRRHWIVLTGLCAGLGLLSKESMLAFLMAAWLFVLLSRTDWCEWRRPACWLMTARAAVLLTPVLAWNARHGWVMFQHSATHFELQNPGLGTRLIRAVEFLGSQLGVVSPVTCLAFCAIAGMALRRRREMTRPVLFLMCFSGIPLACVFGLSLVRRVQPNWPAPFYAAAFILTAAWLLGRVQPGFSHPFRTRLLKFCVVCGIVTTAGACLAPVAISVSGLAGSRIDPTFRLRGWRDFADQVAESRAAVPRRDETFVLVTTGRSEASELAFYLPGQPDVSVWNPAGGITSQYDLWPVPAEKRGWDALIVAGPDIGIDPRLAAQFQSLEERGRIRVPLGNGRCREAVLWLGRRDQPAEAIAGDYREFSR